MGQFDEYKGEVHRFQFTGVFVGGFVGKDPRLLGLIPQSISTFIFGTGSH